MSRTQFRKRATVKKTKPSANQSKQHTQRRKQASNKRSSTVESGQSSDMKQVKEFDDYDEDEEDDELSFSESLELATQGNNSQPKNRTLLSEKQTSLNMELTKMNGITMSTPHDMSYPYYPNKNIASSTRGEISAEEKEATKEEVARLRLKLAPPWMIIHPESRFAKNWFGLNVIFLLFTALVTPYEVSLLDPPLYGGLWFCNRIVDLYFFTDIFIQFNLAYLKPTSHKIVTLRSKIAKRYLRTFFLPDVVSVIPFDLLAEYVESKEFSNLKTLRALRLLRLLKLVRVIKASHMLARFERQTALSHATLMLIKFAIAIVIMGHWMACTWCMMAKLEPASSWLTNLQGDDDEVEVIWTSYNIYSAAVYWAVVTITSVGYGDISATNPVEYRVCTICVIISSCLWAYIIGSACGIISNLDVALINHHQTMDQLNYFIRENKNDFSTHLRSQMREFFHHTSSMRRTEEYHSNIISRMSPVLQREVANKYCGWIAHVPYFTNTRSSFIVALVNNATFMLYIPQERVRTCDELKIVMRGMGSFKTKVLSQGSVWGTDFVLGYDQRCIELRRLRDASWALALTYLEVMMISSASLEFVIRSFPMEEANINQYAARLAAQTNILRVASFIKRCGGIRQAYAQFNDPQKRIVQFDNVQGLAQQEYESLSSHGHSLKKGGSIDFEGDDSSKSRSNSLFHAMAGSDMMGSTFTNNTGMMAPTKNFRSYDSQYSREEEEEEDEDEDGSGEDEENAKSTIDSHVHARLDRIEEMLLKLTTQATETEEKQLEKLKSMIGSNLDGVNEGRRSRENSIGRGSDAGGGKVAGRGGKGDGGGRGERRRASMTERRRPSFNSSPEHKPTSQGTSLSKLPTSTNAPTPSLRVMKWKQTDNPLDLFKGVSGSDEQTL